MEGWLYGKGLIYLTANISADKISIPQGQLQYCSCPEEG